MTPVLKRGLRTDVSNYRPVILTLVCCKVLEQLIRKSLLKHMIDNGYLHGFVQGRSCTAQLLKIMDL